jgi:hypothetical protein
LYRFIAGFAINAVLAAQMVVCYWNAPTKKSTKGKQKEKIVVPSFDWLYGCYAGGKGSYDSQTWIVELPAADTWICLFFWLLEYAVAVW